MLLVWKKFSETNETKRSGEGVLQISFISQIFLLSLQTLTVLIKSTSSSKIYLNHSSVCVCLCIQAINNPNNIIVCVCVQSLSCVQLFVTLWTVILQAPLSMKFSRQEYWSELPCLPPGDLPDPGIKPASPVSFELQVESLPLSHQESPITLWYTKLNGNIQVHFL